MMFYYIAAAAIVLFAIGPASIATFASAALSSIVYLTLFLVAAVLALHILSVLRDDEKRARLGALLRGNSSLVGESHGLPWAGSGLVDTESLNENALVDRRKTS